MAKVVQCGDGQPLELSREAQIIIADILIKVMKRKGMNPILDIELKENSMKKDESDTCLYRCKRRNGSDSGELLEPFSTGLEG